MIYIFYIYITIFFEIYFKERFLKERFNKELLLSVLVDHYSHYKWLWVVRYKPN